MRLPPIWAGFAGHVGCTVPDQRFSLPGTNPSSEAVAHMKTRVIPAFGVALGAVLLGGVLAAPGWAQGSCLQGSNLVAIPCVESIERITPTSATITNQDTELKWRVKIRGKDGLRRRESLVNEDNIDDANMVTATPPIPGLTFTLDNYSTEFIIIDGTATTLRDYTYEITIPSAAIRRYSGTVTLTLGAFKDLQGNGVTAGETTPRGANDNSFTINNANRIDNLRADPISNGLRVRWRAAPGAQAGYLVRWRQTGSTGLNTGDIVTSTFHDITGLTVGNEYIVRVDTRQAGQGPNGRATITGTNFSVTARVSAQLANIPSTGSVDADSDTPLKSPNLPGNGENSYKIVSETATDSGYGSYQVTQEPSSGEFYDWNWVYRLNKDNEDVRTLAPGQMLTDKFTIQDNSVPPMVATVTITITGVNDAATFGGTSTGSVTEDATETMATGTITVNDVDGDNTLQAQTVTRTYGDFVVNSNGSWTYTLDNSRAATNALSEGQTVSEELRVTASDGTVGPTITITITGADDQATIEGNLTGAVTEDATETMATGTVTLSDVDGGSSLTAQTDTPGKYGTFSLNATSGAWTYSLDNNDPDTNALGSGQTVNDETFAIAASDGASATVTISITGADDQTSIDGDLAGSVTEDATETMATGTVTSSVVGATFTAQTDVDGTYGKFSLATSGVWTYTLNNSLAATNALAEGVGRTDSFTIAASDGSTASVVITITGADDQAIIEGDLAGSVTEDATETMATGTVTLSDVDGGSSFTAQTDAAGKYGTFSLNATSGAWTYSLDNSDPDTNALRAGQTVNDETFAIAASDGASATVTITVTGAADQGEIGGDVSGSVREGAGDEDDQAQYMASGRVKVVGDTAARFTVQTNEVTTYGTFSLTADGFWTYRLDNDRDVTAALGQGEIAKDSIEIEATASDNTSKMANVTITVIGSEEEAAAPVTRTVAVTGYLQGRAEVLLGKQPELGGFLKNLSSGITSEGQVSVDVRDGALMGFDGSFVRDDLWGALSVARSEQGSGKTDQLFGTLGYHDQVTDATLVGLMLQFDQADGKLDAGLGSIDGQGWLFGPYFAAQYQAQPQVSPLTLEGRLLYGPTSNDVRFVDGGTGAFDTQRWLASFRLEGEVLLDYDDLAIRLIPHFDAGWIQDKVEAFTDSAGMQVSGQTIRFSEVALGSDIEVPVRFDQRDAMITGGLSLVSTREQSQGRNARVSVSDTYGRLELGLGYRLANGIELEFGGSYDDVEGTDSEDKFSLSFGLSSQF